ncbi:hypothetical protein FPCIR_6976 [Fusarium pseudocircinatum]|uniref:Uncharacterized protein n=1 Tax=Fusarium pseudocircinatum TaxID=56676 RepID=A0A8H5LD05_9HYPO|nr:hypothetical protein FPCIR_6976 [Fusarium pseudocircinatum]
MLFSHTIDLTKDFLHLSTRSLDGGISVALPLPALNVTVHLVIPALLFLRVVTELANVSLGLGFVDKLQAASFAHAVFFVALLTEVPPAPVAAYPAGLVKVAHGSMVSSVDERLSGE